MLKKFMTIAMIGAMVLTSCTEKKTIDVQGEWNIVSLNGKTVEAEKNPYIGFDVKEGKVYGNASCNYITGTFDLSAENIIKLGNVASTMMSCPDMELEQEVLAALAKVGKIENVENALSLRDAEGNELMKLEKRFNVVALAEIKGKWDMVEVNSAAIGENLDGVPYLIIDAENSKVAGFAGYNNLMGNITLDAAVENSIQFTEVAGTRKMGINMAFEDSVLQAVESVRSFGILADGKLAMFDANGNIAIKLVKGEEIAEEETAE